MSKESARAFMQKLDDDPTLREELSSIGARHAGQIDISANQVAEVGARHGFTFSADEIVEAKAECGGQAKGELSEHELTAVAGGSKASLSDFNFTHLYDKASPVLAVSDKK